MLDAIQLSWLIIRRCANNGNPISHLQLQKILYSLQVLSLQKTGKPLFKDKIYAWQFGPVVKNVYYKFNIYSSVDIFPTKFDPNPDIMLDQFLLNEIDKRATENPWDMVDETHQEETPWYKIYHNRFWNDDEIPLELIREYVC